MHDPDTKIVLGKKIHAGGMSDGKEYRAFDENRNGEFISAKLGAAICFRQPHLL